MKCTNCGFNAENDPVCPICGQQLAPAQQQQPPQPAANNPYQNTYNQPVNRPPYPQPPVTPPQPPKTPPKKGANPWVIVLLCVVGIVIAAGIALALMSPFMESRLDKAAQEPTYRTDIEHDEVDPATADSASGSGDLINFGINDKIDASAVKPHKIGESTDFGKRGTLTLSKVEKSSDQSDVKTDYTKYKLTMVIQNNTDKEIDPYVFSMSFYDIDGRNLEMPTAYNDYSEPIQHLFSETDDDFFNPLKPGEKRTQVEYINVKNDVKKVYAGFSTFSESLLGGNTEEQFYGFDFSEIK